MILTNAVVTFYCACTICCGPQAKGITASGKQIQLGMIAAPRHIKFGTKVTIENKQYTVEDRTARRYNDRFDIYVTNHKQAIKLGIRTNTITIYDTHTN